MILKAGPGDPLFEFGEFIADPVIGRLYHRTEEVPLTPKAFKVLMVLVEMRGQRVEKDDLLRQVWPDTFVEENNLARNISMVRKALHERDADREHIVTVTGHGYRFSTPVRRVTRAEWGERSPSSQPDASGSDVAPPINAAPLDTSTAPGRSASGGLATGWHITRTMVSATSATILVVATVAFLFGFRERGIDPPGERRLWQLTSTGRLDGDPTWSPDGRLVAYSSDRSGNFDIWVQPVHGGSATRITSGAVRDWQPAWSPDARYIAFRSERNGGGLFVVPALGGTEQQITSFGYRPQWSPDGSRILFWNSLNAFVVGLDGAAPERIEALPGPIGRFRMAWHPDGLRISVYGNDRTHGWSFWTVPLDGGPPVRSRTDPVVAKRLQDARLTLDNFVWAHAGDALFFEGRSDQTQNVWRIGVDPRTLEWVAGPDRLTTGASLESGLALSPDGTRLAFCSRVERTLVWAFPFDPLAGRITGAGIPVTPEVANTEILDISPDGSRLVYRLIGRGRQELWIRSLEHKADRLRTVESAATIVQPRWSRDGTQLAYLRRPEDPMSDAAIVLLRADDEEGDRVLSASRSAEMVYDWSVDGRAVLVRCRPDPNGSSPPAICLLPITTVPDETPDIRVIAADAERKLYAAKTSPDGRWISFIAARDSTQSAVFVVPAAGGDWMPITDGQFFDDKPRWSPDGRMMYFLSNRTGLWNVWGRPFDPQAGLPTGDSFQVTQFDSSVQMVQQNISDLQMAVTGDRLILPVTQVSGAIWVLENVDR